MIFQPVAQLCRKKNPDFAELIRGKLAVFMVP